MTRKIAFKTVFIAQNPFQNSKLTFKPPKSFLQLQNPFRDAKIIFTAPKSFSRRQIPFQSLKIAANRLPQSFFVV